uniref:hypothetical protein n=1 Tax=Micromonospora sp. S4605 TaxID=1420897 RepID=UPI001E39BA80|nr:hypothetical protein [Micromonospora sp. S4605]
MEYRADRPALLVLLGALMTEAGDQLDQLNGHARPIDLHDRFLAWARPRVPGDERGGAGNVAPARRGPGTVDGGERQNVPRES